jgi:hypothetical protein
VRQDEATLVQLQQDLARAWLMGDRPLLEGIIVPDWTSTGPDGQTSDRMQVVAQVFETGVHKIHDLKIGDVKARVFGDAAVVTGRTHGVGEFAGAGYDVVIRFTDVFPRRAGTVAGVRLSRKPQSEGVVPDGRPNTALHPTPLAALTRRSRRG